jgi:hypothetical protein
MMEWSRTFPGCGGLTTQAKQAQHEAESQKFANSPLSHGSHYPRGRVE